MSRLLAHQGGWDELLLAAALVLGMLGISRLRRRSARTPVDRAGRPADRDGDACAYCGASLAPADSRCPSCGFRTRTPSGPR